MIMNVVEFFKTWNVPIVSAPVLAVSAQQMHAPDMADHTILIVKGILQIILLVGTILFTVYQVFRARGRWKRERELEKLIGEAQGECEKAKGGDCPLAKRLDAYDNAKT